MQIRFARFSRRTTFFVLLVLNHNYFYSVQKTAQKNKNVQAGETPFTQVAPSLSKAFSLGRDFSHYEVLKYVNTSDMAMSSLLPTQLEQLYLTHHFQPAEETFTILQNNVSINDPTVGFAGYFLLYSKLSNHSVVAIPSTLFNQQNVPLQSLLHILQSFAPKPLNALASTGFQRPHATVSKEAKGITYCLSCLEAKFYVGMLKNGILYIPEAMVKENHATLHSVLRPPAFCEIKKTGAFGFKGEEMACREAVQRFYQNIEKVEVLDGNLNKQVEQNDISQWHLRSTLESIPGEDEVDGGSFEVLNLSSEDPGLQPTRPLIREAASIATSLFASWLETMVEATAERQALEEPTTAPAGSLATAAVGTPHKTLAAVPSTPLTSVASNMTPDVSTALATSQTMSKNASAAHKVVTNSYGTGMTPLSLVERAKSMLTKPESLQESSVQGKNDTAVAENILEEDTYSEAMAHEHMEKHLPHQANLVKHTSILTAPSSKFEDSSGGRRKKGVTLSLSEERTFLNGIKNLSWQDKVILIAEGVAGMVQQSLQHS